MSPRFYKWSLPINLYHSAKSSYQSLAIASSPLSPYSNPKIAFPTFPPSPYVRYPSLGFSEILYVSSEFPSISCTQILRAIKMSHPQVYRQACQLCCSLLLLIVGSNPNCLESSMVSLYSFRKPS